MSNQKAAADAHHEFRESRFFLMDGKVLSHRPEPSLARYVETLWYYGGSQVTTGHTERVLPNGRFQLVIDLAAGPLAVSGMRSQYIVIDTAAIHSVMGVVFRPGGAGGFFVPADDFYNQVVLLDRVWGSRATQLRDRLHDAVTVGNKFRALENALLEAMRQAGERRLALHPAVQYGLEEFRRAPHIRRVIEFTREAGLSRRRFSQLFRQQVGMTPKLYCRLRRFREVVQQIATGRAVDWADVAIAGGYCDQAHLIHEFRDFSGLSPSRYLAAERPFLNHVRVD